LVNLGNIEEFSETWKIYGTFDIETGNETKNDLQA